MIRDVTLSAGQCATWLTLDELAKLTHYPPASISAQSRHMRKPRFGAYAVVKRCRAVDKTMRAEGFGAVWEYSVLQEWRAPVRQRADQNETGSAKMATASWKRLSFPRSANIRNQGAGDELIGAKRSATKRALWRRSHGR